MLRATIVLLLLTLFMLPKGAGAQTRCFLNVAVTPLSVNVCKGSSAMLTTQVLGGNGQYTYNWQPITGLSNAGSPNPTVTPEATTTYTLRVTDSNGCTGTTTLRVTIINANPLTVTPSSFTLCAGSQAVLKARGAESYRWAPNIGLNTTVGDSVIARPTITTTYTVTGKQGQCFDTRTITVTVLEAPDVQATAAQNTICETAATILTATGAERYRWIPNIGLSTDTGATVAARPNVTTTYTVVGTSPNGCTDTSAVTVNVTRGVRVVPDTVTICNGNTTTLSASGALNYSWAPSEFIQGSATGANVIVRPEQTTTFTVTGTGGSCPGTKTVRVIVRPLPTLRVTSARDTICNGTETRLTATGADRYLWSPETGLNNTTGANVIASPSQTTVYTVRGIVAGCVTNNRATIRVVVKPTVTIFAEPANASICLGDSIRLWGTHHPDSAVTFRWAPADGLSATTGDTIMAAPRQSTVYTVTGTYNGCATTYLLPVTVNPKPTLQANKVDVITRGQGQGAISLFADNGRLPYRYSIDSVNYQDSPNFTNLEMGNYRAYVQDGNGCVQVTQVNINRLVSTGACQFEWVRSGEGEAAAQAVTTDRAGNVVVAGYYQGTLIWGRDTIRSAGARDIFVAKVNAVGRLLWIRSLGGRNFDEATSIAVDAQNNIYVGGFFAATITAGTTTLRAIGAEDYILVKYSATGNLLWARSGGGGATANPSDRIQAVTVDAEGNVVVAGFYTQSLRLDNNIRLAGYGEQDAFIAKYTPNGQPAWAVRAGGAFDDEVLALSTDSNGSIYIAGYATDTATFGNRKLAPPALGLDYAYVAAYTIDGGIRWAKALNSPVGGSRATGVDIGRNGEVVATGYYEGSLTVDAATINAIGRTDVFTLRLNRRGEAIWLRSAGGPADDEAHALTTDDEGNAYIAGHFTETATFDSHNITGLGLADLFVAKYDTLGRAVYVRQGGGTDNDYAYSVALDRNNSVFTAGEFFYNAIMGDTALINNVLDYGAFVAKVCTPDTCALAVNVAPAMDTLCAGMRSQLRVTVRGGVAPYTYHWLPEAGLSNPTIAAPVAEPQATTDYTVLVTDAVGCQRAVAVPIVRQASDELRVTPAAPTICSGAEVLLTATGATVYTWEPARYLTTGNTGSSVTANPPTATTFTVTGIEGSCVRTRTVRVGVEAIIRTDVDTARLCAGTQTRITATGARSYNWAPATGIIAGANTETVTVRPNTTTTYTVTGITENCAVTRTVHVQINTIESITAQVTNDSLCRGDSTDVRLTGADSYTWSPQTGVRQVAPNQFFVKPNTTTNYIVTGVSGGCTQTERVRIFVRNQPALTYTPTNPIVCPGGTLRIVLTSGADSYRWEPTVTFNDGTKGADVTVSPATTTQYTVTSFRGGCGRRDSFTVNVGARLGLTASAQTAVICKGNPAQIIMTGATNYSWTPAEGVTLNQRGDTVLLNPATTTVYTVSGNTLGCFGTTTVSVDVLPLPTVGITAADTVICEEGQTTLAARGDAITWAWKPSDGLSATAGRSVTARPFRTTTYTVIGTGINDCRDSATVTIAVGTRPRINVSPANPNFCMGGAVTMEATGAQSYTWEPFFGLNRDFGATVIANPPRTITYTVTGTTNGCSDRLFVTVNANPLPAVRVSALPITCSRCTNGRIIATATSGTPPFKYSIDGINYQPEAIFTNLPAGRYAVIVADINGCSVVSDSVTIALRAQCPTPGALTFGNVSATSVVVAWSQVTEAISGYEFSYRRFGTTESWRRFILTENNIALTNLLPDQAYETRVRSICNPADTSGFTPARIFRTTTLCTAPANFRSTERTDSSITLAWDRIAGVTNYTLSWRINRRGEPWVSFDVPATATTWRMRNLEANTPYVFRIRTKCANTSSDWGANLAVRTLQTRKGASETENDFNISAYPNPSTGTVKLNIALAEGTTLTPVTVTLIDITGRALRTQIIEATPTNPEYVLDYTGLVAGVYFMEVEAGAVRKSLKIVLR